MLTDLRKAVQADSGLFNTHRAAHCAALYSPAMIHLTWSMLSVLVVAAVLLSLWFDNARTREAANRIAAEACERRSLQLLDGTVALVKLRPRWAQGGPRIERTYVFDYSAEPGGRSSGFLIMNGLALEHLGLEAGE